MTSFKNISDDDREVTVDGQTIVAPKGEVFEVPDEQAFQLEQQPHFEQVGAKKTPAKQGKVRQSAAPGPRLEGLTQAEADAAESGAPIQSVIEGASASEQGEQ